MKSKEAKMGHRSERKRSPLKDLKQTISNLFSVQGFGRDGLKANGGGATDGECSKQTSKTSSSENITTTTTTSLSTRPSTTSPPSTPSVNTNAQITSRTSPTPLSAKDYINQILEVHSQLSKAESLQPSPRINALFGDLVSIAIKPFPELITRTIMSSPLINSILNPLHKTCSLAESHLESHWALQITASTTPSEALKAFPYFQNYVDLARMEIHALRGVMRDDESLGRIAFIGSGPLPLTSLCVLQSLNRTIPAQESEESAKTRILNIDSSLVAVSQSQRLCEVLGSQWSEGMEFSHSAAGEEDLNSFDVVFLAALVGNTQEEKECVLEGVVGRMRRGGLVVVRSARGCRGLLYPEFDFTSERIGQVLEVLVVVHPWNYVVNSVIIGRVR